MILALHTPVTYQFFDDNTTREISGIYCGHEHGCVTVMYRTCELTEYALEYGTPQPCGLTLLRHECPPYKFQDEHGQWQRTNPPIKYDDE